MPKNSRIFSPSYRKRKAYWTAFQVFMSYAWLKLKSKFLGKKHYERNIKQLHLKNADRVKNRIQELNGLFVKFGQLISNLSNVLPLEFRSPLEELQDHVKAKPYEEIEDTIQKQLGKKPSEIFSNFHKEPLAVASIGQVHRAELNGVQVVVKIQHQNIDKIADADLQILKNLVKLHGYFLDMKGLDHTYNQVKQMIEEELDYGKEAKSMLVISDNLKEVPELKITIPKVFPEHSTIKILTSTYCEGIKIGQIDVLKTWGLDLEDIATRLIQLYCKMIVKDGFYHADPHPGNILVSKSGEIILLDFGAVAHLTEATKKAIPELIEAVVRNDTDEIVTALKTMGFVGTDKASKKYIKKLINIFQEFLEEEVEFDGLNFQNIKLNSGLGSITSILKKVDLKDVSNNLIIPKDYILLNRTLVLLMGNAFQLAPKLNAIEVARPYLKDHVLKTEYNFTDLIVKTLKSQITTGISLPGELSQFLKTANDSTLEEEMTEMNLTLQRIYFLGKQFLWTTIIVALVYFFINYSERQWLHNLNGVAIVFAGVMLLKAFYKDFKSR